MAQSGRVPHVRTGCQVAKRRSHCRTALREPLLAIQAELLVDMRAHPHRPGDFYPLLGGGVFWPRLAWQAALPVYYRRTPDISALADPYTGVPTVTSFDAIRAATVRRRRRDELGGTDVHR